MEIGIVIGNDHRNYNYIKNLKKDDKLIAIKTQIGLEDLGASGMTFEVEEFIEGNIYKVHHISNFNGQLVAYVADTGGCLHWVTPELFKVV